MSLHFPTLGTPTFAALLIIHALAISATSSNSSASFDCSLALSEDELAICNDPLRANLDRATGEAFRFVRESNSIEQARQLGLEASAERRVCGGDNGCIELVQLKAMETNRTLAANTAAPSTLAAPAVGSVCAVTEPQDDLLPLRATPRGPRLDGLLNGTSVTILELTRDDRGLPWARIEVPGRAWVYANYLDCQVPGEAAVRIAFEGSTEQPTHAVEEAASLDAAAKDPEVLMLAAAYGETDLIALLVEAGADVNAVDSQGWSALAHAAAMNEADAAALLLNLGARPTADEPSVAPVIIAAITGSAAVMDILVGFGITPDVFNEALMVAAVQGNDPLVGRMVAAANASPPVMQAIKHQLARRFGLYFPGGDTINSWIALTVLKSCQDLGLATTIMCFSAELAGKLKDAEPRGFQPPDRFLISSAGDWHSYLSYLDEQPICFALTQPVERQPVKLDRGPAYLHVTFRPANDIAGEISFTLGFPVDISSPAVALAGNVSYDLFADGESAWLIEERDAAMIEAMGRSESFRVWVISEQGNENMDVYSMAGFADVLESAREACDDAAISPPPNTSAPATTAEMVAPTLATMRVKSEVSLGYLNLRSGPGQNHEVIARIPAGSDGVAMTGLCTKATDIESRFSFCPVEWRGRRGWVSSNGLE